jgi:hypothetical protein
VVFLIDGANSLESAGEATTGEEEGGDACEGGVAARARARRGRRRRPGGDDAGEGAGERELRRRVRMSGCPLKAYQQAVTGESERRSAFFQSFAPNAVLPAVFSNLAPYHPARNPPPKDTLMIGATNQRIAGPAAHGKHA